jgi:hypothetical protein
MAIQRAQQAKSGILRKIDTKDMDFVRAAYPARDREIGKFNFNWVLSLDPPAPVFTLGLELAANIFSSVRAFRQQRLSYVDQILCMKHTDFG